LCQVDIGNQAVVKGKGPHPRGKSTASNAQLSPFSCMTTCSDEESFLAYGNTDTHPLDPLGVANCFSVRATRYEYRHLIAANDDPIYYEESATSSVELGGYAVFGTSVSYGGTYSSVYDDVRNLGVGSLERDRRFHRRSVQGRLRG
ncbi:unnamed protein product, partial [Ectocarpus fasciculatus]